MSLKEKEAIKVLNKILQFENYNIYTYEDKTLTNTQKKMVNVDQKLFIKINDIIQGKYLKNKILSNFLENIKNEFNKNGVFMVAPESISTKIEQNFEPLFYKKNNINGLPEGFVKFNSIEKSFKEKKLQEKTI